jgi:hypothetical protein
MQDDKDDSYRDRQHHIPWDVIIFGALTIILTVGFIILIVKAGRRGGAGLVMVAAAPALAGSVAAGTLMAKRTPRRTRLPIDREFLQSRLKGLAQHLLKTEGKAVITPTELFRFFNILLKKAERTLFASTQEMTKLLGSMGLKSQVRSVTGRPERRWYDLAGYGTHEASAQ